jgi:putative redox protein
MAHVTVINEHQHLQQVVSGHHHLTADEAAGTEASDAGFTPRELLLASLGACTAIALRKLAARNDWQLGKITVGLRWTNGGSGRSHIDRRLAFAKPVDAAQRKALLDAAAQSPVTQLLAATVAIDSTIAA